MSVISWSRIQGHPFSCEEAVSTRPISPPDPLPTPHPHPRPPYSPARTPSRPPPSPRPTTPSPRNHAARPPVAPESRRRRPTPTARGSPPLGITPPGPPRRPGITPPPAHPHRPGITATRHHAARATPPPTGVPRERRRRGRSPPGHSRPHPGAPPVGPRLHRSAAPAWPPSPGVLPASALGRTRATSRPGVPPVSATRPHRATSCPGVLFEESWSLDVVGTTSSDQVSARPGPGQGRHQRPAWHEL